MDRQKALCAVGGHLVSFWGFKFELTLDLGYKNQPTN